MSGETVFSILDVTEFGAFVRAAIESPEFGFGSEVLACGDQISLNDLAQKWGERELAWLSWSRHELTNLPFAVTRKKAAFAQIPEEVFLAAAPPPVAKELLSMLKSFKKYGCECCLI